VCDGETGLLAEADHPTDLAARIETLARDAHLRSSLGAAGRRRAEDTYSLAACVAGMLRVYEDAMRRPLARPSRVESPAPTS
jgi:glycosyltransferase involved in cell wall biosynthesis